MRQDINLWLVAVKRKSRELLGAHRSGKSAGTIDGYSRRLALEPLENRFMLSAAVGLFERLGGILLAGGSGTAQANSDIDEVQFGNSN